MIKKNKNGIYAFTLIELLAVLVVIAILLAIVVPILFGTIKNATMGAMEIDAKLVLNAVERNKTLNSELDPIQYNDNMQQLLKDLGISGSNYKTISFSYNEDVLLITIKGKEKFDGFTACGSFLRMKVVEGECDFDLTPPVITLNGDSKITLGIGEEYIELGATAVDDIDGNVEVTITGTVDTSVVGIYTITYSAKDSMGNKSSITRTVNVVADNIKPQVLEAILTTNNSNGNQFAKNGDTLTLNITFNEDVVSTVVKIWGIDVPVSGEGTKWTATYQIPMDENVMLEGNVGVGIFDYIDLGDNIGDAYVLLTDVIYDRTSPTCTSSGGSSTWRNTNLTLTGTCSDTLSGCIGDVNKVYDNEINSTTESPGVVSDKAGNTTTCPANQTVRIDKTAPSCTSSGGSTAWTNGNRTLTGTCSDTLSGCAGNATKTYSTEINSTTESPGVVSDNAGNTTTCPANQTVRIDKTPPSCTSSGGSTAWTNGNRTITGTCSDALSGCIGNATKTYSTDINSTTESPGTVSDNAGNSATCPSNQTVRIDKTPPTCSVSGGNTAWTNGNRTITGTCSDTLSGCATATKTYTYSSNTNTTTAGPDGSNDYRFTDNAGNQSAICPKNQTVKIDKTAPTCTITLNGSNVQINGSDALSGLGTNPYSWNGSSWGTTNTQASGTTAFTVTGYVRDAASNIGTCSFGCSDYSESSSNESTCTPSGSAGVGTTYTTCSNGYQYRYTLVYRCNGVPSNQTRYSNYVYASSTNALNACNSYNPCGSEGVAARTCTSQNSVTYYIQRVYTRTCN